MRFVRTRKEDDPRLGIAPLIDIVFLLLIFFMVTSHFDLASGVRLQLPKMTTRLDEAPKQETTIVIDQEGNTYLEGERISGDALKKRLAELVGENDLERVILQADQESKHGAVLSVIDLARTAGVRSVIIAARWSAGEAR
ncbi:MAG: biopolymer transporter ExbD [Desulfobacteraceae bacterium]|jgi:biopolymer transport protein ExbD